MSALFLLQLVLLLQLQHAFFSRADAALREDVSAVTDLLLAGSATARIQSRTLAGFADAGTSFILFH